MKKLSFLSLSLVLAVLSGCGDEGTSAKSVNGGSCDDTSLVNCKGTCINPMTSSQFCGAKDHCADYTVCTQTQKCRNGSCSDVAVDNTCPVQGQVACEGICIDPQTENEFCGADENCAGYEICAHNESCQEGHCVVTQSEQDECAENEQVLCDGACVDPKISKRYCGADANCKNYIMCGARQFCRDGDCVDSNCEEHQHEYSGLCEDDSIHDCGQHGYDCTIRINGWKDGRCDNGVCKVEICEDGMESTGDKCEATSCLTFEDAAFEHYVMSVSGWDRNSDHCLSPSEVNAVTEIPRYAFKDNQDLQSIKDINQFPNLTAIREWAFSGCSNLKKVSLDNVDNVEYRAFYNSPIEEITFAKDVYLKEVFGNCDQLAKVDLPEATTVAGYAFKGCAKLKTLNLPKVKTVEDWAFSQSGITDLNLPEATSVGTNAFSNCASLTSVSLPKVETVGGGAFAYTEIAEISLPSATTFELNAFGNSTKLRKAILPKAVLLKSRVFNGCTGLREVTLSTPEAITLSGAFDSNDVGSITPNIQLVLNPNKKHGGSSSPLVDDTGKIWAGYTWWQITYSE